MAAGLLSQRVTGIAGGVNGPPGLEAAPFLWRTGLWVMPCQASSQISVHLRRRLSSDSLLLPSSLALQRELPVKAEGHMHLLALRQGA